ncbi:serine-rich adhesin for platelets-like [Octopus vulgaris]|uniref:Serine-rich adhesin for platelets-like n=1 Tax=Octopus vulgaris TaxID=6645 RepID=A0AA36F6N8_OCTVU|nr:serine-rich adhesin for platelets-like [Octopus vulgaris]
MRLQEYIRRKDTEEEEGSIKISQSKRTQYHIKSELFHNREPELPHLRLCRNRKFGQSFESYSRHKTAQRSFLICQCQRNRPSAMPLLWFVSNSNNVVVHVANKTNDLCPLPKLTSSQKFQVGLSFNGIDVFGGPYEVTVIAKEPSVQSSNFGSTGAVIEVKFDRPIDTAALVTCDKIFTNTTQLGNEAACNWYSDSTLTITVGKGNDLIQAGSFLTFENDAVKAKGQSYAYPNETTITVGYPDQPVSVESVIEGPSKIPSCGVVQYTGTKSRGSGGRKLEYEWTGNMAIVGGSEITFTLNVTVKSNSSIYSTNSIKLKVKNALLQVIIRGGSERSVGVSEAIELNGSLSYDPDGVTGVPEEYVWGCTWKSLEMSQPNPCYIKGKLFPDLPNITSPDLKLDADSLILSYTYIFTLTMTKGERKSSASVQIVTVPGQPPQVLFEPLPTKVLTNQSLKLTVYITSTSNFSIEWRVDNSNLSDYGYFDINNPDNQDEKSPKTEIVISVSECETDSNAYPLLYQFYSNSPDGEKTPLNVLGTQPSVTISGPRSAGKDTMRFSVQALQAASRNFSSEISQNLLNGILAFAGSYTSQKNIKSANLNLFTTKSMLNQPLTRTLTEKVTFTPGNTLEERYVNWECSKTEKCQGAVAQILQIVNGASVFPLNDTKTDVVSDVIDFSLYNPSSGKTY